MAQAEERQERKGDVRVYLVSGLFFICILAGGAFLAMYIAIPETKSTTWYPVVGMALVGIPWVFWILTCMYRRVKKNGGPGNEQYLANKANHAAAAAGTAAATRTSAETTPSMDSPVDSPGGGGQHVRFGATTVMNEEDSHGHGEGMGGPVETHPDPAVNGEEGSHGTMASSTSLSNDEEGSSIASRESELPLTFSISS